MEGNSGWSRWWPGRSHGFQAGNLEDHSRTPALKNRARRFMERGQGYVRPDQIIHINLEFAGTVVARLSGFLLLAMWTDILSYLDLTTAIGDKEMMGVTTIREDGLLQENQHNHSQNEKGSGEVADHGTTGKSLAPPNYSTKTFSQVPEIQYRESSAGGP